MWRHPDMSKSNSNKIIYSISMIFLMIIASYINNILIRIIGVFILAILFDLAIEILEYTIYKNTGFILCLKEILTEKNIKQKQANIISLLFVPFFQTITVIILSVVINLKL